MIEHSIHSGRRQVFETVFAILRDDIHDDKVRKIATSSKIARVPINRKVRFFVVGEYGE